MPFIQLVGRGSFFHQQTRICNNIAFYVFQAISELVRENAEPCSFEFHRIMIPYISKQQK